MTENRSATTAYNAASQTVSSLRAVVMLYDGMIKAIYEAKSAIEVGRIEDRFNATQKASKILLGLQANLDFTNGGQMAVMLDQFYHTIFRDLQQINMKNSETLCESVVTALKEVRQSWNELAEQDDRGSLKTESRPSSPERTARNSGPDNPTEEPADPGGGFAISI